MMVLIEFSAFPGFGNYQRLAIPRLKLIERHFIGVSQQNQIRSGLRDNPTYSQNHLRTKKTYMIT